MDRKEEIYVILKDLLRQAYIAIDNNHHSINKFNIMTSSIDLVKISKQIEKYTIELKTL